RDRREAASRAEIEPPGRPGGEQPRRRLDGLRDVSLEKTRLVVPGDQVRDISVPLEQEPRVAAQALQCGLWLHLGLEQVRNQGVPRLGADQRRDRSRWAGLLAPRFQTIRNLPWAAVSDPVRALHSLCAERLVALRIRTFGSSDHLPRTTCPGP